MPAISARSSTDSSNGSCMRARARSKDRNCVCLPLAADAPALNQIEWPELCRGAAQASLQSSFFTQGAEMRRLLAFTSTAAVLTAGTLISGGASAAPLSGRLPIDDLNTVQDVAICFYLDGWNG